MDEVNGIKKNKKALV